MFNSWEVQDNPPGLAGISATLDKMAELVTDSEATPWPRTVAISILNRTRPRSVAAGAAAFKDFVNRNLNLINEPVELLQPPDWLLEQLSKGIPIWGDCDDSAMLVASLLAAAGLTTRLRAVWPPDNNTGDGHVFAEVEDNGRWRVMDATAGMFGRQPPSDWPSIFIQI